MVRGVTHSWRRGSRIAVSLILAACLAVVVVGCGPQLAVPASLSTTDPVSGLPFIDPAALPPEALDTLGLIDQDGPFPFDRDGVSFQNRD